MADVSGIFHINEEDIRRIVLDILNEQSASEPAPQPQPEPEPVPEPPPATLGPVHPSSRSLGINLHEVTYWSREWPYSNVIRAAKYYDRTDPDKYPWRPERNPNNEPLPPLNEHGYPLYVENGLRLSTLAYRSLNGHYPAGKYILTFDGEGRVDLGYDVNFSLSGLNPGAELEIIPGNHGINIEIVESKRNNPVRNIVLFQKNEPGFFHTRYLSELSNFNTLRFMDWGQINNSNQQIWSDRTKTGYFTQHGFGVAYEHMFALAEQTNCNPWICIPHKATDDYIRKLAEVAVKLLAPNLTLCLEYTNEAWNPGFAAYHWLHGQQSNWYPLYAQKALKVFNIFTDVFGSTDRLYRVIGGQINNNWLNQKILDNVPDGTADALAIAPYFGGQLGKESNADEVRDWTLDQLFDAIELDIVGRVYEDVQRANELAKSRGLKLVAYEGGQHLVGVGNAQNDQKLTDLFVAANRDNLMGLYYKELLRNWPSDAGVFNLFNYVDPADKSGAWGLKEYQDEDDNPKWVAVQNAIKNGF